MIIYHDNIKLEAGLLTECALHCVSYRLFTVEYRNNDRSLVFKLLLIKIRLSIVIGINQGSHLFEMMGASLLHLYLYLPVARVHIVELLFSTLSQIKTKVIESCKLIFLSVLLRCIVEQILCLHKPETSEIEVITK